MFILNISIDYTLEKECIMQKEINLSHRFYN